MRHIWFVKLDEDGEPVLAWKLIDGQWQEVSVGSYWNAPYEVVFSPCSDELGTGNEWTSSDFPKFAVNALRGPGELPTIAEA